MGLVGMGRAFNLRFMPNGPLRTNCYHRPMPHVGFFGGGGNMSYTENISIQNGPTGFWGFMTGLAQGLFGGGMFGCGMGGGLFGLLNAKQAATPQGTGQAQGEDAHLKNLKQAYGKKYEIVSHPDKKGIYQAFPKDGGKPIEGTYQELCDKLAEENEEPTVKTKKEPEKTEAQLKEEKAKEQGLELKDKDAGQDDKDTGSRVGGEDEGSRTRGSGTGVTRHGGTRINMNGWYNHNGDKDQNVKNIDPKTVEKEAAKTGQSAARHIVTHQILTTKIYGGLNKSQIDQLTAEVIKHNPSVFNSDGSFKKDANGNVAMNKFDVPTMDWMKKNISGVSAHANADAYNNKTHDANQMSRVNYRETFATKKYNIYYNEATKRHCVYNPTKNTYRNLPADVKQVNSDGTYFDTKGEKHNLREIL